MDAQRSIALPVAVRVYPEPADIRRITRQQKTWRLPGARLVFDTETRTGATQRLTFGSYRYIENGECLEENLFFGDDLPNKDRRILERYVVDHKANVSEGGQ